LLDQAFAYCPIFSTAALKRVRPFFNPNVVNHSLKLTKDHRQKKKQNK